MSLDTSTSKVQAPSSSVPFYVLEYAPLIWLHSKEQYYPSDIGAQLSKTQPQSKFAAVQGAQSPLTLDNLATLNNIAGTDVWLTSVDDVTRNPAWLKGVKPDSSGRTPGAISAAIIVNDKGNGNTDVFYMYFYAFNEGPTYFGQEVGDHVGDWEHNMIRFKDGKPQSLWYSQHAYGQAFTYNSVEKQGIRPIGYSAKGSHAVYAIAGTHDHLIPGFNLPFGVLNDFCDRGTLYDPALSAYIYSYNPTDTSNPFRAYDGTSPTSYLSFAGAWGDQQYVDKNKKQKRILGIKGTQKYVGGPRGPLDKQLNRNDVCPPNKDLKCFVSPFLRP